jgi:coiled-coil domain-containing protein 6
VRVQQSQVEAEEEFITNKLMKRLEQLKQEKQILANEVRGCVTASPIVTVAAQYLASGTGAACAYMPLCKEGSECLNAIVLRWLQVEVEEEFLTNTLQKKLEKVGCDMQLLPCQHNHKRSSIVCCGPYFINHQTCLIDLHHTYRLQLAPVIEVLHMSA